MALGSNNPIFTSRPHPTRVQISTANTARDGTGTLGTLITAGSDGTKVYVVRAVATGTTTDGMLRIFVTDGGSKRLVDEISVAANTPSATAKTWSGLWTLASLQMNIDLAAGEVMYVSTNNAETFNVFSDSADY